MAEVMDLHDAASLLDVHYQTAYRWVREGRLPATRVGGRYRIAEADAQALRRERERPEPVVPAEEPARRRWSTLRRSFGRAIAEGDEARAEQIVERLHQQGESVRTIVQELFVPTLVDVGLGWRAGTVSIAQEHRSSLMVDRLLAGIDRRRRGRPRGRAIIASIGGDMHGLPVKMGAAALREDGWSVDVLGSDVPTDALITHATAARPDVVVLTVTNPATASSAQQAAAQLEASGIQVLLGAPGRTLDDLVDDARLAVTG